MVIGRRCDPSPPQSAECGAPFPPRLMKAPVAVHPLPSREFHNDVLYDCTQRKLLIIRYKKRAFASLETASLGEGGRCGSHRVGAATPLPNIPNLIQVPTENGATVFIVD
jgi:hypothetical protein